MKKKTATQFRGRCKRLLTRVEMNGVSADGGFTVPWDAALGGMMWDIAPYRSRKIAGGIASTQFKPKPGTPEYHAAVCLRLVARHSEPCGPQCYTAEAMRHLRLAAGVKWVNVDADFPNPSHTAIPKDLIPVSVVLKGYIVSSKTLRRYRKDGKIKGFRPRGAATNSAYQYSRTEIAKLFQPKS